MLYPRRKDEIRKEETENVNTNDYGIFATSTQNVHLRLIKEQLTDAKF